MWDSRPWYSQIDQREQMEWERREWKRREIESEKTDYERWLDRRFNRADGPVEKLKKS